MASGGDYVRFSDYEDALASLELVALVAPLVRDKPQYWKWVIVAAHDALQGAMVCACAVGTGSSVQEKKKLAPFGKLLKWCTAGSKPILEPLVLTPQQHKDIEGLHDHFRNDFAHFTPQGWGIEKAGLPRMIRAALDAAEELMRRYHVIGHLDDDQQKRLTDALATARKHLPIT